MLYYFPDAVNPAPPRSSGPPHGTGGPGAAHDGATGHDRYTQRLTGADLSRVLYVYGRQDMIGGRRRRWTREGTGGCAERRIVGADVDQIAFHPSLAGRGRCIR